MRENTLKTIWQNGGVAVNGWLSIPSSWTAEVMAHQGWDSLTIDMQHGLMHYDTALHMLQGISTTAVTPLARVPWNEPGIIMKLLDAGALGIICPMVNTRAQAEAFVGACRYAPEGYRSYGPTRASVYAGKDYADHANEAVITMAMVETAEALENVDEILSTPGLDGVYIGPADLGISLGGKKGADFSYPPLLEAIDTILATANKYNVIPGIHTGSPQQARQMLDKGFRFVTILSDSGLLAQAASRAVAEAKGGESKAGGQSASPY